MSEIRKISTPRGDARSIMPPTPSTVTVNYNQAGSGWFGSLAPPPPVAPPEVTGRTWDFPTGYNLSTTPRQYEPLSFESLRTLADSLDILRITIERRKDQLARLPFKVRLRHGNARPAKAKLSAETRSRIDDVTDLFRRPSQGRTWRSFIREYLEDVFVLDNACIHLRRHPSSGDVIGLSVLDGSTLSPVLDDWGKMPEPAVLDGRPLPEYFDKFGYEVHNGIAWPVTHRQKLKGLSAVSYSSLSLIARSFNPRPGHAFGLSPVEQVATTVAIATKRNYSLLRYYDEGNVPAGIYNLPESWSVDQVQQFQDYWDSLFVGNLSRRRQMRFVSGNGRFHAFHEPPPKD